MSDRIAAAHATKAREHAHKHERVLAILDQMEQIGQVWTFSQIAQRAGCHRTFVSGHHRADWEVAKARINVRFMAGLEGQANVSAAALRAENHNLRAALAGERRETQTLRKRLELALGREAAAEMGADAPATTELQPLRDELDTLRRELHDTRRELREREEELEAATRLNKRILRERNTATERP
jgi:hypothetical protein